MRYPIILFFLITFSSKSFSQDKIEWSDTYRLSLNDFQSSVSKIGDTTNANYTINPAISLEFSYSMSSYEFMLTKNFNSKVATTFNRKASYIVSPDEKLALSLLSFSQLSFNLLELHARKFRKKMFESKKVFSDSNFYQKLYDEILAEYNIKLNDILNQSEFGKNENETNKLNTQVMLEISELSDYCKACKPKKK